MIDPTTIAAQNAAAIRDAWRRECNAELLRCSWKLRRTPFRSRELFCEAFVETIEVAGTKDAARALFEEKCRAKAIPPALIWLLVEVVFNLLWEWWKKRREQA